MSAANSRQIEDVTTACRRICAGTDIAKVLEVLVGAIRELPGVRSAQVRSEPPGFAVREADEPERAWVSVEGKTSAGTRSLVVLLCETAGRAAGRLERQAQAHKMEALGAIAGGVAHDFNNVLMVITGYCQMLLDRPGNPDAVRLGLEEILKASTHGATLTGQLLAFGRRNPRRARAIDLNSLVDNLRRMLCQLMGERIELVTDLAPQLGQIHADKGQLEQVLLNLAANARDAMPDGGMLHIETHAAGHYILLSVRDTGHGMSQEVQLRAFEPFFTTKENGRGTGLGLSTVSAIVKQNHGKITMWSDPGKGTTFELLLPRASGSAEAEAAEAPAGAGR